MKAYYNELDKKAAAWLRELIADGLVAPGHVDERSITDVQPEDLDGYTQCHFFAGVGGWSIAARLAGWPDDREIWSASCPCQPFSVAGKGAGTADARHLWPDFFRLVRARRPAAIVGEQVAAAVGKDWFLGVRSDLESIAYVGRGVVVPACAVNAPHRRDRLWFVAGSRLLEDATGSSDRRQINRSEAFWPTPIGSTSGPAGSSSGDGRFVGHAMCSERRPQSEGRHVDHRDDTGRDQTTSGPAGSVQTSLIGDVADCDGGGRESRLDHATTGHGHSTAAEGRPSAWDRARWLIGHDGKARRVEPSIPLLVDGLPARAPLLRGYGNAIVPQLAAEVIGAWLDCEGDLT